VYRSAVVAAAALLLAACATPYTESSIIGGFDAKELREDVYRVAFGGNGYTSNETVQTYWLYKCAELTLEKGYYGFEILSDMRFVMDRPRDWRDDIAGTHDGQVITGAMPVAVSAGEFAELSGWRGDRADATSALPRVRVARGGGVIIVPTYGGAAVRKPAMEGDIHLIRKPFTPAPPKLFAAGTLKNDLQSYVTSDKCGFGNVCPHVHEYLFPRGGVGAALTGPEQRLERHVGADLRAQVVDQGEALLGLDVPERPAVAGFESLSERADPMDRADLVAE
jgi:hypothetical protein